MARNRFLFDLLGLILGGAVAYFVGFFITPSGTGGSTALTVGGLLAGGAILGFFAFKNDGVKIAGIVGGLIALLGIIAGIVLITGATGIFGDLGNDFVTILIGPALTVVGIFVGIIIMIAGVVICLIFVAAAAIGSAIGEAVWKDKEALPAASVTAPYQPTQVVSAPVEPTPVQQVKSVVCANCGVSNPGTDSFCTNCGAKIR
jgi:hypothetical protein